METEKYILVFSWAVTLIALWFLIPRAKVREAHVAFLFMQIITWLLGLSVVQLGLIEYPYREFPKASQTSFTFEYFLYPAISAIFNVRYPIEQSILMKLGYYIMFCSAITVVEAILERNTQLISYLHWDWYWTWGSLFISLYISRIYCCWFFKKE